MTGTSGDDWIDVTVPLQRGMATWPGDAKFDLELTSDMEQGARYTSSAMRVSLHAGTHMDAPAHFITGGLTVDEMPFDATLGRCRVIAIDDPASVTVRELERHGIAVGERLLLKTRGSELWAKGRFRTDFVTLTEGAASWLVERGVRCIGIDYLSIAPPRDGTAVHLALLGAGVAVIEGLDLSGVEPGDYEMVCVPLRIVGAEASPVRVAIRPA